MREMRPQKVKPAVKYDACALMGRECGAMGWLLRLTVNRKIGHYAFCVKCKPYGEKIDGQLQLRKRKHALSSAKQKSKFSRGCCHGGDHNSRL